MTILLKFCGSSAVFFAKRKAQRLLRPAHLFRSIFTDSSGLFFLAPCWLSDLRAVAGFQRLFNTDRDSLPQTACLIKRDPMVGLIVL